MSEYAVSYVAEEHAPDPVHSPGDPTLPGKIGIWLFLASEIMFFVAILGSYVIYRSGTPQLFAKNADTLNKLLAGVNTVVLILSSLTMALAVDASQKGNAKRAARLLALTVLCAFGFLTIKFFEYKGKFEHYTFQYVESPGQPVMVYDAHVRKDGGKWILSHAHRAPMPETGTFDLHLVTEGDVKAGFPGTPGTRPKGEQVKDGTVLDPAKVTNEMSYGPWKNLFFSCYFTLTGIHMLHVIGGIIPLGILTIQALRGRLFPAHTEYTGLYWHFVDLVWIFLFPLLYLI